MNLTDMDNYKLTILSNGTEWCYYCWKHYLEAHPSVSFFKYSFPLPSLGNRTYRLLHYLYYPQKNRIKIIRPFLHLMISCFFRLKKNEKNIIILYDWNELATDKAFINGLRRRYPHSIIVYVFTNVVEYTGAKTWGVLNNLNSLYDAVYAFDKKDAEKYDFEYLPLIYAKEQHNLKKCTEEDIDIFYVGKAKDRLDVIHEIFEKCKSEGLKCDFNIVNVPEDEQLFKTEINYNKPMSYKEVINKIKRSKCLLDVIQGNSTGLTIKVAESVVYEKKLLTNNPNVTNELHADSNNVLLYDKKCSISEFILSSKPNCDESCISYFSPDVFVRRLVQLYEIKHNL